jgi:hypothetical protein
MKTAVEWLVEWLKNNPISYGNSYDKAIEQANKMFEEQIKEAWFDGVTNWDSEKEVEDYINETFKSE